jgi:hypothetical protein
MTDGTTIQIAVDCTDPHAQARFWAAALGYEVEDHHELIEQMTAAGHATAGDVMEVDGRLAWRDAAACRDPEGRRPRMFLQRVPEPKVAKNRFHLDLHVGEERRAAELERLVGLGATKLYDGQLGPQTWVTLADPEGNEFCLA